MILSFRDRTSADIFHGEDSNAARKISKSVWPMACKKLDMINAAHELRDLQLPPGNRLKRLKGNLAAFHSIRVNDQYRVIFRWSEGSARDVQITDYYS